MNDAALLSALAERPDDRALRLVFADALLERGDPRGEVITLSERGNLSLSEKRRVARLTEKHGADWLGGFAPIADLHRTRFEGGFVTELAVGQWGRELDGTRQITEPAFKGSWQGGRLNALAGSPELSTVKNLMVLPAPEQTDLRPFLGHRVLAHLQRLELSSADWKVLNVFAPEHLRPEVVGVSSFEAFRGELAGLESCHLFKGARRLDLVTTEFVNPLISIEIRRALRAQQEVLWGFEELRLVARYAVFEGAVTWLLRGDEGQSLDAGWGSGKRWSIEYGDVIFTRERVEGGAWSRLLIDCSGHETTGGLDKRINAALGVLVQMAPARLTDVEVRLPQGAALRKTERGAFRAALRRSGTVRFTLGAEVILP